MKLPNGTRVKIVYTILDVDAHLVGESATVIGEGYTPDTWYLEFDNPKRLPLEEYEGVEWHPEELEVINNEGPDRSETTSSRHSSEVGDAPERREAGAAAGLLSQGS